MGESSVVQSPPWPIRTEKEKKKGKKKKKEKKNREGKGGPAGEGERVLTVPREKSANFPNHLLLGLCTNVSLGPESPRVGGCGEVGLRRSCT